MTEYDHSKCTRSFSEKFDSYFCVTHDVWTESPCKHGCSICDNRPASPSEDEDDKWFKSTW